MSKYLVVESFKDLQDNGYKYGVGDEYPRSDLLEVSEQRIEELSTNKNRKGRPVIKAVEDTPQVVGASPEEMAELQTEEIIEKPKRTRKKKNAD